MVLHGCVFHFIWEARQRPPYIRDRANSNCNGVAWLCVSFYLGGTSEATLYKGQLIQTAMLLHGCVFHFIWEARERPPYIRDRANSNCNGVAWLCVSFYLGGT